MTFNMWTCGPWSSGWPKSWLEMFEWRMGGASGRPARCCSPRLSAHRLGQGSSAHRLVWNGREPLLTLLCAPPAVGALSPAPLRFPGHQSLVPGHLCTWSLGEWQGQVTGHLRKSCQQHTSCTLRLFHIKMLSFSVSVRSSWSSNGPWVWHGLSLHCCPHHSLMCVLSES